MSDYLWRAIVIGAGATALMDLWAIVLKTAFGLPLPNWGMVGRWFAHLPRGTVFHDDIGKAAPVPNEKAIGWIAHYAIGILYAGVLLAVAGPGWAANPTFLPAWILGLVTVGAGWFLLQPGMGAGWAASRRPDAWRVRLLNIVGHTVFAVGLWGTALLLR
jgi:hypothetical protein